MGCFLLPRKLSLILFLLIISSSLKSTSSAGRGSKLLIDNQYLAKHLMDGAYKMLPFTTNGSDIHNPTLVKVEPTLKADETDEVIIHERLLRMNTHDYGRYDASPSLPRPRHKLIPN